MKKETGERVKVPDTFYRVLQPGKVLVDYGPVTMTIQAHSGEKPNTVGALDGAKLVPALLGELVQHLSFARRAVSDLRPDQDRSYPEVLRRMVRSVRRLGEGDFTPMAAVAGTFSDLVREAVVMEGSDRVVVNNGGDISLYLGPGSAPLNVGIVSDLATGVVTHAISITPGSGIGGIATSGLGGRSLTKGVASAVTVLAENGSLADAAATAIANATDCGHQCVKRCPAEEIDDLTDIRGHLVTLRAGPLPAGSVEEALKKGLDRALLLFQQGMIEGVVLFVQGRVRMWPENVARPLA